MTKLDNLFGPQFSKQLEGIFKDPYEKEEPMLMTLNEIFEANGKKFPFTVKWQNDNKTYTLENHKNGVVGTYEHTWKNTKSHFSLGDSKKFTWIKDKVEEKKGIVLEVGKKYKNRSGYTVEIERKIDDNKRGACFFGIALETKNGWNYDFDGIWSRDNTDPNDTNAKYDLIEEITEKAPETLPVVIEQKQVLTPEQEKMLKEKAVSAQALCVETSIRIALFTRTTKKVLEKDVKTVIDRVYGKKTKKSFTQKQLTSEIESVVNTLYAE